MNIKGIPEKTNFTSVLRDHKGFLWLGTFTGLFRYDGYKLRSYNNIPSDTTSLSHNYIYSFCTGKDGNILAGTYGAGLNIIDQSNGLSKRISQEETGKENIIILKTILSNDGNNFWVASPGQLLKLSSDFNVVWKIDMPFIVKPETLITDIKEISPGRILITGNDGIYLADENQNDTQKINFTNSGSENTGPAAYTSISLLSENEIWIAGKYGIMSVDAATLKPILQPKNKLPAFLQNTTVNKVYTDKKMNTWIAAGNKLFVVNHGTGETNIVIDSIARITDIFQDAQGITWVTTRADGLYRISSPPVLFYSIPGFDKFSKNEIVQGLCEETDSTWLICTNYALVRYNRKNRTSEKILTGAKSVMPVYVYVLRDSKNNLWVSTQFEGVFMKKAGTGTFLPVNFLMNDSSTNIPGYIIHFAENKKGELWASLFTTDMKVKSGLFLFDKLNNRFMQQNFPAIGGITNKPTTISQIQFDNSGNLWMASLNAGLFNVDFSKPIPVINKNLHISSELKTRLTLNILSTLLPDKEGNIWAGTVSSGVNYYYTEKDSVEYFSISNGLPSNAIYRLEEDDKGFIWISTDNGLSRYDKKIKRFINFNNQSGLPSSNFYFLSSLKTSDGNLVFGTSNGKVIYFNPLLNQDEINKLPVVFSDILLSNKSVQPGKKGILTKASYLTDTIRLKYSQNVISFELTNLDLIDPETYSYAYKLEGFDKDWTYISNKNSITYTNLNPGTYTLLVKNANHLGVWNETPSKLILIISPPWWRTWWFLSLIVLAVASAIYILFRYRLHQKLKIYAVRQRLHRDLHDDVGATLSSVKAYSEILKDNPNNPVIAELIKDNSAEMIDRLEVIAWATNPVHDNFESLKNRMIKFIAPLGHSKKINCMVESAGIDNQLEVPGDIRQNLFLVFKEAANNTFKYAEATTCSVRMFIQNRSFILAITDNGRGSDGTIKGVGSGWKNMEKRAAELNGKLIIESSPEKGTAINLSIPFPFKIPKTWDKNGAGMN